MICQNCGKNDASMHIKSVINGEALELHLCPECAKALGYETAFSDFGFSFPDILSSFFAGSLAERELGTSVKRCSKCGTSFDEIAKNGRTGCAECYSTFHEELEPIIERIHGRTKHLGKIANKQFERCKSESDNEIEKLKKEMQSAVERQDYEHAATVRDKIKKLEGKNE